MFGTFRWALALMVMLSHLWPPLPAVCRSRGARGPLLQRAGFEPLPDQTEQHPVSYPLAKDRAPDELVFELPVGLFRSGDRKVAIFAPKAGKAALVGVGPAS